MNANTPRLECTWTQNGPVSYTSQFQQFTVDFGPIGCYTPPSIANGERFRSAANKLREEVKFMAGANVEEIVKRIVVERLSKDPEEVTLEASFIDDLGADSLDQTELLMALEEEFNVDIDDEANSIETVGDAVNYIKSKLS
jgi:acyl carrier protein